MRKTGHAYTPQATATYENWVKLHAAAATASKPPLTGPLRLGIEVYMPIPGSWSEKKQRAARSGEIPATVRPDWDNLAKLIADSLNQLVYADDRLIVAATVSKRDSERPRLVVRVEPTTD